MIGVEDLEDWSSLFIMLASIALMFSLIGKHLGKTLDAFYSLGLTIVFLMCVMIILKMEERI